MTNGRQKGARGEREAALAWGMAMRCGLGECRRGQQFHGGSDSPDVVQPIKDIHLEVKRTERGNPYSWMEQASYDAKSKVPVVLHRRNHQPWLVILRLDDAERFILAAQAHWKTQEVGGTAVPGEVPGEGLPPGETPDERASWLFRNG